MKLALLVTSLDNIGDEIQSFAVSQHIAQENFILLDRDFLNSYKGDKCAVVMNGWFSHQPRNFPPSDKITPIFFGFHISHKCIETYKKFKSYFIEHQPIGCRDQATADLLESWGINSYLSGCATMTFPNRIKKITQDKNILIDVDKKFFRKNEKNIFLSTSHKSSINFINFDLKMKIAENVVNFYRDNAQRVVTSRIHCAMPCFSMGIPTIYTGIIEPRTDILNMIDIPKISLNRFFKSSLEDLPFRLPAFEDLKARITLDLKEKLNQKGIQVKS